MLIAHIVSYIQPEFGYEEYYSAREQAALGHDVHVITSDRIFPFKDVERMLSDVGSEHKDRNRPAGVEEFEGFKIHRGRTRYEVLYDYIVYDGVEKALRGLSPEVVHAHGPWQYGTRVAARLKTQLKYALVIDEHAYSTTYDQAPSLRNALLDIEYRTLRAPKARYALSRADAVVAVSDETERFLREFYKIENVHMIPLGVDHRLFCRDQNSRRRVRSEIGIGDDDLLLVSAGRIERAKRLELIIEGAMLSDDRMRLIIVGQGDREYIDELVSMADERVTFAGFKTAKELSSIYSASDIGLWGKASITIREAMSCSLPLVLLDTPDMASLLRWDNGISCELTPKGVSLAITKLMNDPKLRNRMGSNGRRAVEGQLSVEVQSRSLIDIYGKAISDRIP
ncbi:MAG: glycosyltransferase family 4 protein [Candidatus Thermoplasmatota archaeon]|nr:glycosyltransferase family 4 protein [Candidatus Thermoplasmatota archaeon]